MSARGGSDSSRRIEALGTGNWNNRGIDAHIKRPAGCSSAALKKMGMKRIDGIPHPLGTGNTSEGMTSSLKYPKNCLVTNEHVYDGVAAASPYSPAESMFSAAHAAGIEASKTVQYNNYAALSTDKEGGKTPAWLVGQQTKRRIEAPFQMDGNPIKHEHVKPHKSGNRPIRRMGPTGNKGPAYDNGASRLNWNLQKQQLNTGPLRYEGIATEDWKAVSVREHISPLGEVLYNVGGLEDLRPPCTQEFTKADKPASLLTKYVNDQRELGKHERDRPEGWTRNPKHVSVESADMVKAMYHHNTPSQSRTSSEAASDFRRMQPLTMSDTGLSALPEGSEYSDMGRGYERPMSATGPMSARSRQSGSLASYDSRSRASARMPMSARGSQRSDEGGKYERGSQMRSSIASSYYTESYYSESDAGSRVQRSKSADGLGSQRRNERRDDRRPQPRGGGYTGQSATPMSGLFSDPSRTVTSSALNEALRGL